MRILTATVFHILLAFRAPIRLALRLATGMMLLAIFGVIIGWAQLPILPKLLVFSLFVGFSSLNWFYDRLLLRLAPPGVQLTLFR